MSRKWFKNMASKKNIELKNVKCISCEGYNRKKDECKDDFVAVWSCLNQGYFVNYRNKGGNNGNVNG